MNEQNEQLLKQLVAIDKMSIPEDQKEVLKLRLLQSLSDVSTLSEKKEQKERRGRKRKLSQSQEAWLIKHAAINNPTPTNVKNVRSRPQDGITHRTKQYGEPIYGPYSILNPNLPDDVPYALSAIFDDRTNNIIIATYISILKSRSRDIEYTYTNETERAGAIRLAKQDIDDTKNGKNFLDSPFYQMSDYLEYAHEFRRKERHSSNDKKSIPRRVGFALALAFLNEGYTKDSSAFDMWSFTVDSLKNLKFPSEDKDVNLKNWAENAVEQFLPAISQRKGEFITSKTLRNKTRILKKGMQEIHDMCGDEIANLNLETHLDKALNSTLKKYKNDILEIENFPPLQLKDIRIILERAFKISPNFYHQIVLQLSTALRNNEMERLSHKHLLANGTLQVQKKVDGEYLTTKTSKKLKREDLVNPCTSIITKVILKFYQFGFNSYFTESIRHRFWAKYGDLREGLQEDGAHQRSLRTTAATNLMFAGGSLAAARVPITLVQNRMSHKDGMMVATTYAKNTPKDAQGLTPDEYFKTTELTLNGVALHKVDNAWDLWLLKDMVQKYEEDKELLAHIVEVSKDSVVEEIKKVEWTTT